MAYSLQLADAHAMSLVQDNKLSFLGLIVLVDNEYVLGYTYGVVDKNPLVNCDVLDSYSPKIYYKQVKGA